MTDLDGDNTPISAAPSSECAPNRRPGQPTDVGQLERLLWLHEPIQARHRLDDNYGASARGFAYPRTQLQSGDWRLFVSYVRVGGDGGGDPIADFTLPSGDTVVARIDHDSGELRIPFSVSDAFQGYVTEEWKTALPRRGLSPRQLNGYYRARRFLPRSLQIGARRVLIRRQGLPDFPRWPFDSSVPRLLRFYARCLLLADGRTETAFRWFWPDDFVAAMTLTHDVETSEGLRPAVEIADVEEELGFRSSFNVGSWYSVDPGIVRELTSRGFEIGLHGIRHDRSLFASRAAFDLQRPVLARLARQFGAEGFRSPSTHRVFDWLAELPFSYDCSIPHSDPFEPQPGGCCTIWPFFIGPLVELPYTLPQDHTLFTLLGQRTVDGWVRQAMRLEQEHGLIQCVTHPDPGYLGHPGRRSLYADFLQRMAERVRVWKALPRDVATWWWRRDAGDDDRITSGIVRIDGTADDVVFEPPTLLRA